LYARSRQSSASDVYNNESWSADSSIPDFEQFFAGGRCHDDVFGKSRRQYVGDRSACQRLRIN